MKQNMTFFDVNFFFYLWNTKKCRAADFFFELCVNLCEGLQNLFCCLAVLIEIARSNGINDCIVTAIEVTVMVAALATVCKLIALLIELCFISLFHSFDWHSFKRKKNVFDTRQRNL